VLWRLTMDYGRVLWFDVKKGFGFVRRDSDGLDVFVHYSKIIAEPGEFRLLNENDRIEFETFLADRGGEQGQRPQAKNIRLLRGNSDEVLQKSTDKTFRGHINRTEAG